MFAQTVLIGGYVAIVCTPPFPVVVMAFFFLGYGMATNLALGNVFAANLQNGTKMLGIMHGSYGIGGTVGPISTYTSKVMSLRLRPSSCNCYGYKKCSCLEPVLPSDLVDGYFQPRICWLVILGL
jgi:hypothetical protein